MQKPLPFAWMRGKCPNSHRNHGNCIVPLILIPKWVPENFTKLKRDVVRDNNQNVQEMFHIISGIMWCILELENFIFLTTTKNWNMWTLVGYKKLITYLDDLCPEITLFISRIRIYLDCVCYFSISDNEISNIWNTSGWFLSSSRPFRSIQTLSDALSHLLFLN